MSVETDEQLERANNESTFQLRFLKGIWSPWLQSCCLRHTCLQGNQAHIAHSLTITTPVSQFIFSPKILKLGHSWRSSEHGN